MKACILPIFACWLATASTSALSEGCVDYIYASRQVRISAQAQQQIASSLDDFCHEWDEVHGNTSSRSLGIKYEKFSFDSGGSSQSMQAAHDKYCRLTEGNKDDRSYFNTYLSNISPEAFETVKQCLAIQNRTGVLIVPTKIEPEYMEVSVRNASPNSYTASLLAQPHGEDVNCEWHANPSDPVDKGGILHLSDNHSALLNCRRSTRDSMRSVTVQDTLSNLPAVSVDWGYFDRDGYPISTLAEMSRRIEMYASQLSTAVLPFDSDNCPAGWQEYVPARGRFIRGIDPDGAQDPDGKTRKRGDVQEDDLKAHRHSITLHPAWGDKPEGAVQPRWGHDDGVIATEVPVNTSETGGKETRPKNVVLLYCKKE
ncbi:TPA: hypothetical protein QDB03_002881 [Burkholderia vietnamiensis]|nr:hypothetical protein [Burkholderia vietnamiensis]